jgi:tetratricopeptide (TPR) repeat protein
VKLKPVSPTARSGLALAQADDLQVEAAIATFEKAIKLFPNNGLIYQEFGRMLLIPWVTRGGSAAEPRAVAMLQKAIMLDSSLDEPHYLLGDLALQKEMVDEALQQLKMAAELNPKSSKVHFALERTYRKLGQMGEVAPEHEIFERLRPTEEKTAGK